jgi:hypothetical protein
MSSAPVYALRNVKTIILVSFTVGLNVVRRVELLCRGHSTSGPDSHRAAAVHSSAGSSGEKELNVPAYLHY